MKIRTRLILPLMLLGISACSTVTIYPENGVEYNTPPTFEETKSFFMWGLVGEYRVDVKSMCEDRGGVAQMQSQQKFVDGLLIALTFGIYTPHSVRIWCKN